MSSLQYCGQIRIVITSIRLVAYNDDVVRYADNTRYIAERFVNLLSETLQLLFCSFFRSGYINNSSDSVSSLWITFDCTCSEFVPNMRVSSMCSLISVFFLNYRAKMHTVLFSYTYQHFPVVLFVSYISEFESSNSEVAFWGHIFSEPVPIHRQCV